MTTIACDGKSMAGETLTVGGGEIVAYGPKVHRLPDGRVFGCAGYKEDAILFRVWMEGGEKPTLDEKFEALILTPAGTIYWLGNKLQPCEYLAPMTLGSGGAMALGAMLAGKSPAEAVAIAIQRDIHSGGDVIAIHLESIMKAVA